MSTTTASLRNRPNADGRLIASVGILSDGLLRISGSTAAQIARNGHGRTLRIAQDLPDPTSGLTADTGQPTQISGLPCPSTCRPPANAPSSDTAPAEACGPTEGPIGVPSSFSLPPDTPAAVAIAIGWALQQLGTPYSYGGDCTDPHSDNPARRCDCSSLVQQAYHAAGTTLPRTAAAQSRTGTPVHTPEQLRPGDVLFVAGSDGTAENPGHEGMYIGDQLIVEAPHPGASVHLTPLTAYWTADLHARRLIAGR